MLRPKKTIPGLVVAALALTGCGDGEGTQVDRRGETVGGGAAGSSGAGGQGGASRAALDDLGGGGAGGVGDFNLGGAGGAAGAAGPVSHAAQGVEAYCMKIDECYPGLPYYSGCVVAWENVQVMAYSLSNDCDQVIGAYLSCLAELTCEQIQNGEQYTCLDTVDQQLLESCSTEIDNP